MESLGNPSRHPLLCAHMSLGIRYYVALMWLTSLCPFSACEDGTTFTCESSSTHCVDSSEVYCNFSVERVKEMSACPWQLEQFLVASSLWAWNSRAPCIYYRDEASIASLLRHHKISWFILRMN